MQKRYVIYSAMVGAYDDILQPKVIDERFDYILFSNEIKEKNVGVWQVRPISYYNPDNTRICRYVKTHPEELLPEYDVSIWMDSNIQILTEYIYCRVEELDKERIIFSAMWHPAYQCIYEEAFAVMHMRVEYENIVVNWCHELRKRNYPQNNGLFETGVLYRKHKDMKVIQVDALWWKCIDNYSRRDQLSCNYALWTMGVPCHFLFGEKTNIRELEGFSFVIHNDIKHNQCPHKPNEAWLMRHCWKHPNDTEKIKRLYYCLYAYPRPKMWTALLGQWYRMLDRLKIAAKK